MVIEVEIPCEDGKLDLLIRQAEPSDSRGLIYLLMELEEESDYLLIDRPTDVTNQKQIINQYAVSLNSIYLVLEVDGQYIGIAVLAGNQHPLQKHRASLGVAILQEYCELGVGSLLLESLIDFAENSGIEVITLEVVSENKRAINLYKKYQFYEVGRLANYLKYQQRTYDAILMEKSIK
ncbi:GNAT family N-acetyltransferase [Aerococcaceae bacterium DSM 111020]|nr:GNAT family N-acetyltransferase [Aerococcaceae bacterium DSM 111020]